MSDIGEKLYPIRVRTPAPMPVIDVPLVPVEAPELVPVVPVKR